MKKILLYFILICLLFLFIDTNISFSNDIDSSIKTIKDNKIVFKDLNKDFDNYFIYDFYEDYYIVTCYLYFNDDLDFINYVKSNYNNLINVDSENKIVYAYLYNGYDNYNNILNYLERDLSNQIEVIY